MFNLDYLIDLPLIWGGLIATAVFMYVLLDGFDLGCGILFPFAPSHKCRDRIMNSIAPFWDGNETWLVLGGGGLLVAFPLAYAVILPAVYIPVILMLLGLILRGVAFEFRFKASMGHRFIWDYAFHGGSLLAAFMQGIILGAYVQGITVEGRSFAGGPFDWLTPFALLTGAGVVCGYALLGATWLVMKTEDETQRWARKTAAYVLGLVGLFMGGVSASVPFINEGIRHFWFSTPNFYILSFIPLATAACFLVIWKDLRGNAEYRPFLLSVMVFFFGYLGLGLSLWPWVVPYHFTLWQASAASEPLSLMLVGAVVLLPVILAYTAYSYYVFRGKTDHEPHY